MGSWAAILKFGQALLLVGQVGQVPKTISESNAEHAQKNPKNRFNFGKWPAQKKIFPVKLLKIMNFHRNFRKVR